MDWREADSDMPEARQEMLTQVIFRELRQSDAVETVDRVAETDVPAGGMGAGGWLMNVLTAEIPGDGIKLALQEVFERLPGKPIDVVVEMGDRKIEIKQIRPDDLDSVKQTVIEMAKDLKNM